jgi:protein O-GlcNAc transferase
LTPPKRTLWGLIKGAGTAASSEVDRRAAQGWIDRGIAAEGAGKAGEALECYRKAIALDAGSAPAHYNLALAYLETGQAAQAEAEFREALRLGGAFPEAWVGLADALETLGRDQDALAALDTAIGQREHYLGAQFNASVLLRKMGRLEAAQARLREIDLAALYPSADRHAELESVARQLIRVWPDYALGWKALGTVLALQQRFEEAVPALHEALKGLPGDPETHNTLGAALHALGRSAEAEADLRRALGFAPAYYEAHVNLGRVALALGRPAEAEASLRRALELKPDDCQAHNTLGIFLQEQGRPAEAAENFRKAIELDPDYLIAFNNLGNALKDLGRFSEAEASYRRALELKPDFHQAHNNLGIVLQEIGRSSEAAASCRRAIELAPDSYDAHYSLGVVLQAIGRSSEAEASFRRALDLNPENHMAHNSLGIVLQTLGRPVEAEESYRRALALKPDLHLAHGNLGVPLNTLGRVAEAEASFRRALELEPDFREARSNLLFALNYTGELSRAELFEEHRSWARRHEAPVATLRLSHANNRDPLRRLRVGYVSPDFRRHSVAYFIEPLIARHDRGAFEVYCYSNVLTPDGMTGHLMELSDTFREIVGMSDAQAAELVRADSIDILVDLAGHTAAGRLGLFALKPAPVQVTYLGYPNTTGLAAIDWRLTDIHADPPGDGDEFHSERLARLPRTFLCYQPPPEAPAVQSPPSFKRGHITFGSFNTLPKITPEVIGAWARLLNRVPGSRLLLKAVGLGNVFGRERLLLEFLRLGISEDRLAFLPKVGDFNGHLACYHEVDIGLDPFPYNGATTTCEALWMGVPVITLSGDRHSARVGVSLLSNLGLDGLIANCVDEYLEIAIELASDANRLGSLRSTMRARVAASALRDESGFCREVERAYRQMWSHWTGYSTGTADAPAPFVEDKR